MNGHNTDTSWHCIYFIWRDTRDRNGFVCERASERVSVFVSVNCVSRVCSLFFDTSFWMVTRTGMLLLQIAVNLLRIEWTKIGRFSTQFWFFSLGIHYYYSFPLASKDNNTKYKCQQNVDRACVCMFACYLYLNARISMKNGIPSVCGEH